MQEEISLRKIWKIILLYILILILVNSIGVFLPADFSIPMDSDSIKIWKDYRHKHFNEICLFFSVNYIVPILLSLIYMLPKDKKQLSARFINMPFRFAGFGCTGWLSYLIVETFFIYLHKDTFNFNISAIFIDDLIFSVIMSFFCFTIVYFVLETIHRHSFLPKFFPEGKLSKYPVKQRASLFMKVRNFYISIAICPLLFILTKYISVLYQQKLKIEFETIFVLCVFVVLGILLLVLIGRYLSIPLKTLEKGIREIKSENYDHKIDLVSNDDFGDLADVFNDMTEAIKNKNQKLADIQNSIIKGMALMVESRDVNTGGHINRTSDCVQVFVKKLQNHPDYEHISTQFLEKVIKAAPMHDLGKIAVDDAVLRKPGKFTAEEYEMMKTHSVEGAKIVQQVIQSVEDEEFKKIAVNVAHYHHEKWNGTGYPMGLKEEEIPFEARIMALADVFDALVSKRCYKDSFSYDKAFKIIEDSLGTHFDPFLGLQFLDCRKELEALYQKYDN